MAGIGDLVAHLGIDNTGFKRGLSSSTSMLRSFAGGISTIIAPVAGALAGVWGASASVSAFRESLEAEKKLAAVLNATGNAAGVSMEQIKDYAGQLQQVTNIGDDTTVAAASVLAAFNNIKGETFFSVIDSAADLSAIMGGDLQSNVELLGKALNDPTAGLAKLSKAGIQFTEEQENLVKKLQKTGDMAGAQGVILDVVAAKVGGAAKAVADPWTQFQNILGDIGEVVGSLLTPTLNVMAETLTGMLQVVVDGGNYFKEMGIEAAVVLSHLGELLTLGVTQWELFFVQAGLGAAHFFTEVIPTYLTWFADNWQDVLFTALDYSLTLFINLGTNIRNMWSAVLSYLSGNPVEFNWTPLLEGAHSAISSLPDIPERVTTEMEQGLMQDIESMSASIGESMDKQREELTKKFNPGEQKSILGGDGQDTGEKTASSKNVSSAAVTAGSKEALSIIARSANASRSPELSEAKKQTKLQEKTNSMLSELPAKLGKVISPQVASL